MMHFPYANSSVQQWCWLIMPDSAPPAARFALRDDEVGDGYAALR
jgi:hypothetical protein